MGEAVFNEEKLINILLARKILLNEGHTLILNKLRRKEKLNSIEFWNVFELLRQDGPKVRYLNPTDW